MIDRNKIRELVTRMQFPAGMGDAENACSIGALNIALYGKLTDETRADLLLARQENERLRAALREYGNHVPPCATGRSPKLLKEFGLTRWPCTCGFDAALAAAFPSAKAGEPGK